MAQRLRAFAELIGTTSPSRPEVLGRDLTDREHVPLRRRRGTCSRWLRQVAALIGIGLAAAGLAVAGGSIFARYPLASYTIASASMEPTLDCASAPECRRTTPDQVLVDRLEFAVRGPRRGDIVAFKSMGWCAQGSVHIKRVIGLPGESISQRRGVVYIDGRRLAEPYIGSNRGQGGDITAFSIPARRYFVMGDNRGASCDSRQAGTISRSWIIGRVVAVYRPPHRFRLF
jgi:signal peptidase I